MQIIFKQTIGKKVGCSLIGKPGFGQYEILSPNVGRWFFFSPSFHKYCGKKAF